MVRGQSPGIGDTREIAADRGQNHWQNSCPENSDTVRLRRRLNQAGRVNMEECFIIDDVEPEPLVHGADRIDEKLGSGGLHDCG